jgi:excisionase family DNA binding protein
MAKMYLSPDEAALVFNISKPTLYTWVRKGLIKKIELPKRKVYFVAKAKIMDGGKIINAEPVRPKNANPKR